MTEKQFKEQVDRLIAQSLASRVSGDRIEAILAECLSSTTLSRTLSARYYQRHFPEGEGQ
jgi:hypothetical protein